MGTVSLEDLARLPELGVDWDYNDRTWQVDVRRYNGPPLGGGVSTLSDPAGTVVGEWVNEWVSPQGETAVVTATVTYDKSGYEGLYYWDYHFFNFNFGTALGPDYNLEYIFLGIDTNLTADDFIEIKNEDGLPGEFVPNAGQIGTIGHVRWTAPTPDGLDPNEEGSVWFTTQPMKITGAVGEMWDDSAADTGGGYTKQPDCGCDQNTPAQVTKAGWTHWQQSPMGQPRGEKNAATPDWTEPTPGVWRTPGPPAAGQNNIGEEGGYYQTVDIWKQFTFTVDYRFAPEPTRVRPNTRDGGVKAASNQDFGNSGVYIHDRYEVQIIDPSRFDSVNDPAGGVAYGGTVNNDPRDTDAGNRNKQIPGSLYGVDPPNGVFKNWSKPAPDWNTLVIEYCPPTIVGTTITKPARLKTTLNGVVVWDGDIVSAGVPLKGTGAKRGADPVDRGRIFLQSHWGNQVEYRNPSIVGLLANG